MDINAPNYAARRVTVGDVDRERDAGSKFYRDVRDNVDPLADFLGRREGGECYYAFSCGKACFSFENAIS